jgi:hypothetical protein
VSIEIKEVEFNPTVDPKLFEKPAASAGEKPSQPPQK